MDCNNFFVSCERLFRPDLLGKPVAVLSSNDGCIVARSEEVKNLGIPMGAPLFQVQDLVKKHNITLFSSHFALYRDLSRRVMTILRDEYESVSVYSIDEAFFRVGETMSSNEIALLRQRIIDKVGIPVSIGVSSTRTRAKLASTFAKKSDGIYFLTDEILAIKADTIPVGTVWGIGREMSASLTRDGITTVRAFVEKGVRYARSKYGVVGERIVRELMGQEAQGEKEGEEGTHASITSTRSFKDVTNDKEVVMGAIAYHVAHIGEKLRERGHMAGELTVIANPSRYSSYTHTCGSKRVVFSVPTDSTETLLTTARALFDDFYNREVPYKKAGVMVGGIIPREYVSPSLMTGRVREKSAEVYDIVDMLNERFGSGMVHPGTVIKQEKWGARTDMRSPAYTTSWSNIPSVKAV